MGVTGLIPFLSKSSRRANIEEYACQTAAIDAYCWLHKGVFSCADKLARGEPTLQYVNYCLKYIDMLLHHQVKPIMVFDGRNLPAKAETEMKRRESREQNLKKGKLLWAAGQTNEAINYFRRSIDITHDMALNLMKACRKKNIDCIVAPHEADAQLAYFSLKNIAQVVISEDSDLILFGCTRVLFKMDLYGNGLLIEQDKLHISMGVRHDKFNLDNFRYMCILSGCDYLPSLPGIGLKKAQKFINANSETNIYKALSSMTKSLKMPQLTVTEKYKKEFIEANRTFKYQLVYDPLRRKQVPLTETSNENEFVGIKLDENEAFQLAVGNLNPKSLKQMDIYDPDHKSSEVAGGHANVGSLRNRCSIWNRNFIPHSPIASKRPSILFSTNEKTKRRCNRSDGSTGINRSLNNSAFDNEFSADYLANIYGGDIAESFSPDLCDSAEKETSRRSPVLYSKNCRRKLPVVNRSLDGSSANRNSGLLSRLNCNLEGECLPRSRYFEDAGTEMRSFSVLDLMEKEEKRVEVANGCASNEVLRIMDQGGKSRTNDEDYASATRNALTKRFRFCQKSEMNVNDVSIVSELFVGRDEANVSLMKDCKFDENDNDNDVTGNSRNGKTVVSRFNTECNIKENICDDGEKTELQYSLYFTKPLSLLQSRQVAEENTTTNSRAFGGTACDRTERNFLSPETKTNARLKSPRISSRCKQRKQQQSNQSILTQFGFRTLPRISAE